MQNSRAVTQSRKPIDSIFCFSLFVELGGCDFHQKDPDTWWIQRNLSGRRSTPVTWANGMAVSAVHLSGQLTQSSALSPPPSDGEVHASACCPQTGFPIWPSCPLDSFSCLGFEDCILKMLKLQQKWTVRLMTGDGLPKMLRILKYNCKMYIFSYILSRETKVFSCTICPFICWWRSPFFISLKQRKQLRGFKGVGWGRNRQGGLLVQRRLWGRGYSAAMCSGGVAQRCEYT